MLSSISLFHPFSVLFEKERVRTKYMKEHRKDAHIIVGLDILWAWKSAFLPFKHTQLLNRKAGIWISSVWLQCALNFLFLLVQQGLYMHMYKHILMTNNNLHILHLEYRLSILCFQFKVLQQCMFGTSERTMQNLPKEGYLGELHLFTMWLLIKQVISSSLKS